MRALPGIAGVGLVTLIATGCRSAVSEPSAPPGTAIASLSVTSKSFPSNGPIPVDYSCDGDGRSPQLTWSAPPAGTQSFAVIVDDPDAPGGTFTHWIAYAIPADLRALPESVDLTAIGGSPGMNDFKRPGYGAPCPPQYEVHHYVFRVFALNAPLHAPAEPDREAIDGALGGHVLAAGTLIGEFSH